MGSFQIPSGMRSPPLPETSCGYLLQELQMIWDEVGEDRLEREKVLLDLEQECIEVYRRKVDSANISRTRLHQHLAEAEAEFTHLLLCLGERSLPGRPEKMAGTLKEQLNSITPALREMQLRKEERVKQFRAVQGQIQKISAEIAGQSVYDESPSSIIVNENDLSLKKLEEYQNELQRLHTEKNDRLQQVEKYTDRVHSLCTTLGMDSSMIITKVHPTLNELCGISKNISDAILAKLDSTVVSLEEERLRRLEKLKYLGKALTNLWNLMGTPYEDRRTFSHLSSLLSVSQTDVLEPGSLTINIIQQAEAEVKRLDQLKASKMKELFVKKQNELEEICRKSHMEVPSRTEMDKILNLINSGEIDHADILMSMDEQIARAREEASSRNAIMEKVEKWVLAREEERWLEEYNRDENRYSVSRGAFRNLKRAERARVTVNKIPGKATLYIEGLTEKREEKRRKEKDHIDKMGVCWRAQVDLLIDATRSWEEERKKVFLYDEVPLLAMLEEYNVLRQEKEEEKQKQREQKKVQSQTAAVEQENPSGLRPGTSSRRLSNRSLNVSFGNASPLNRRFSSGTQQIESNSINFGIQSTPFRKEGRKMKAQKMFARPGFASNAKEETASVVSTCSGPVSP